jgi:hypothetical protein
MPSWNYERNYLIQWYEELVRKAVREWVEGCPSDADEEDDHYQDCCLENIRCPFTAKYLAQFNKKKVADMAKLIGDEDPVKAFQGRWVFVVCKIVMEEVSADDNRGTEIDSDKDNDSEDEDPYYQYDILDCSLLKKLKIQVAMDKEYEQITKDLKKGKITPQESLIRRKAIAEKQKAYLESL